MKKLFYLIFLFVIFNFFTTSISIANTETMSFDEYLSVDKSAKNMETLKLNKDGNVVFLNKVVLTDKGEPLNDETAYTDNELKVLFSAKGIEPREGCDPTDTITNGTLGCYIDIPENDNMQSENYSYEDTSSEHPIDIEYAKCIESSDIVDYPNCARIAGEKWKTEINNYYKKLEKIMSTEDFVYIKDNQTNWEIQIDKDIKMINKFITNTEDAINATIGYSNIYELYKSRAMLLKNIHFNYSEELKLKEFE